MFKNRHIELKVVKDNKEEKTAAIPALTKDDILEVSKTVIARVAIGIGAVIAFAVTLDTASQIIVNNCDKTEQD